MAVTMSQSFAALVAQQAEALGKVKAAQTMVWPSKDGTYLATLKEISLGIRKVGDAQHPEISLFFDVVSPEEAGTKMRASFDLLASVKRDDGTVELWQASMLKGMLKDHFGIEEFSDGAGWVDDALAILKDHVYDPAKGSNTLFKCKYYIREYKLKNGPKAGQTGKSDECRVQGIMSQEEAGTFNE